MEIVHAYGGTQPYIFVSYAHKDSAIVLPILRRMQDQGFRIWYDEGIEPGTEWPEYIAEHLASSDVVLAMISENSIASANCRRELTFAMGRNKRLLALMLEPAKMSAGMEMQLSVQQSILRYQFRSEEQFMEKVCQAELLQSCREVIEEPEPLPEPEPMPVPKPKKPAKAANRQKKGKKKWPLFAGIPAAIALAVLLAVVLSTRPVRLTEKTSVSRDTSYVHLSGEALNRDTLRLLGKLRKLTNLSLTDCTFDNVTLSDFRGIGSLSTLKIENCSGLSALDLSDAAGLRYLTLDHSPVASSWLPSLASEKLIELTVIGDPGVTAVPALPASLQRLNLSGCALTDISGLENLKKLTNLVLEGCDGISDFAPALRLEGLKVLSLRDCGISSLPGCASLALQELYLDGNPISSAAAFDNLTRLTKVSFRGTNIASAECVEKSAATLVSLDVSHTRCNAGFVSQYVVPCANLTKLGVAGIALSELHFVRNLPKLTWLDAEGCGLESIDGLRNCRDLTTILLANNRISTTTALSLIGSDKTVSIDLRNNSLKRVSLPGKIKVLLLSGNDPSVVSTIPEGTEIRYLVADYHQSLVSGGCPALTQRKFYTRYIFLDVPTDRLLDVKETFGESYVTLVSSDTFAAFYEPNPDMTRIENEKPT